MKRHPLDTISLVFGLLFAGFGLTFLVADDPWDLVFGSFGFGWVLPFVVLAGGAALLVSALRPEAKAIFDGLVETISGLSRRITEKYRADTQQQGDHQADARLLAGSARPGQGSGDQPIERQ